jgi:hypothetical protein
MRVRPWMAAAAAWGVAVYGCIGPVLANDAPIKLPIPTKQADQFRCNAHTCAMPSRGQYPYMVIGLYQAAATAEQSEQLFKDMLAQRYWSLLPNDSAAFYAALQPVSITLPDGKALAVLMAQDEFAASKPQAGDLVRYSAHFGTHEVPPPDPKSRAYWSVDGCVAVICRAQDKACFSRYAQGVFRRPDGMAISPQTFKPLPHGTVIDVDSLLPKRATNASL